ncbi:ATP-binding protein [Hoyosella sp. YIM 151337]|uniref:ATP-binding protein n=1 Tax=Hoyosella sp. YIM 151337 TaxID=2992742 RepID=UPI002236556D|nr:ATP-binding protein [Hoyosella sp. YIM 151337]MCW4356158.1 ATP-binding protein [Hoyosella sp. YIM 151337]
MTTLKKPKRAQARTTSTGSSPASTIAFLSDADLKALEARAHEATGLKKQWLELQVLRQHRRRAMAARLEKSRADTSDRDIRALDERGFAGPGGGRQATVVPPVEYRGTTVQVAGLFPWSVGADSPILGTPLGHHLATGAPVCFDPLNAWKLKAMTAPSCFIIALNGFGKSTLLRRITLGDIAAGVRVIWPGDVKPDGKVLTEKVGGEVLPVGYGIGSINPLAPGPIGEALVKLRQSLPQLSAQDRAQRQLRIRQTEFALAARQVNVVAGLLEIVRRRPLEDYEQTLLASAIRLLYTAAADGGQGFAPDRPAVVSDLIELVTTGHDELLADAVADTAEEYRAQVKPLLRSLRALVKGRFGEVFNGTDTVRLNVDMPSICLDMSSIPPGDETMRAAALLSGWSEAFATIEAAHVLADCGLGPHLAFHVVMDELWQVIKVGPMMVGRIDAVQRLQRVYGVAITAVTHSIAEMEEAGALGFVERSRARIIGPVPRGEVERLAKVLSFSGREKEMVIGWSDEADQNRLVDQKAAKRQHNDSDGAAKITAAGTGHFLLKLGEGRRPGIPFKTWMTPSERASGIHDTDVRLNAANKEKEHAAQAAEAVLAR